MRNKALGSIITLAVTCTILATSASPAIAKDDTAGFNAAKSLYKQSKFVQASQQLEKVIAKGDKRPVVYLYLAHSYYSVKNRAKAIQVYKKITESFPGTGEARIAVGALNKLGIRTAPTKSSSSTNKSVKAGLLDSVTIIPPKFGHPPVSQNTIRTVKGIIAKLPKRMFRILDEGGAKLHIGPNMIDRWPDALNGRHSADGHLYCNEPGRTYDLNMYIFERPLISAGSTQLGRVWSDSTLRFAV